jgi:hypothetical protein
LGYIKACYELGLAYTKYIGFICQAYARVIVIVKHFNLLIYLLVRKIKYMLSIWVSYTEYILQIITIVKQDIF